MEPRHCLAATGLGPSNVNLNQADIALMADVARGTYGVDGTGIRVGIISNSFNALGGYAYDVSRGVLPDDVTVVHEGVPQFEGGKFALTDEGRGMAQLVHAVAPGADLFFSANTSVVIDPQQDLADDSVWGKIEQIQIDFADRIRELAIDYGCQIIVDDMFVNEPFFQDGPISQAISEVTALGVTYFTAANNDSNYGYQAAYQPVAFDTLGATLPDATRQLLAGKTLHNFGTADAPVAFQRITLGGVGPDTTFELQWAQPWGVNASDVTLVFFDSAFNHIYTGLENPTGTWPAAGLPAFTALGAAKQDFHIAIVHEAGVSPDYLKWILITNSAGQISVTPATGFQTGTSYGHTNSAHGASVGAVNYWSTPAYRESPRLSDFSSWGGIPVFFDAAGEPLAEPEYRPQPRFVAPQFGDTSFFEYNFSNFFADPSKNKDFDVTLLANFSGTSAAAPNAAAVAALMKQLRPELTPDDIFAALAKTATPFAVPGYLPEGATNVAIGAGLINARNALAAVANISISGVVFEDLDRDGLRDTAEVGAAGMEVFLDGNGNGRRDATPAAGSGQAFVGWTTHSPVVLPPVSYVLNPNYAPGTLPTNRGLLPWPTREQSAVTVVDMAGVVTDVGVAFELTRGADARLDEPVAALFVTLVSPQGIRVPVAGTRIPGDFLAYTDTTSNAPVAGVAGWHVTLIPAGTSRLSVLAGQEPRPAEEFPLPVGQAAEFSGSSSSVSLGDLSAFFGTPANGTWQLEVTNADSLHSVTLSSWSLFVATAEPQTTTDSQGRYAFTGLAPSATGGVYVPTLAPSSEQLPGALTLAAPLFTFGDFAYERLGDELVIRQYYGASPSVVIPSIINGLPVTAIGAEAFSGRTDITSVDIPEGIATIGSYAFTRCSNLTRIILPDSAITLETGAFLGCSRLTEVHLGTGVKVIGSWAFYESGLVSVTIPDNVESIGDHAFRSVGLTQVSGLAGIKTIGYAAFHNCHGLTTLTLGAGIVQIGSEAFNECVNLNTVYFLGSAPTTVGTSVFQGTSPTLIVYHRPDATTWGSTFAGKPTATFQLFDVPDGQSSYASIPAGVSRILKRGQGTLVLSNGSAPSGDTVVEAGTFVIRGREALGTGVVDLHDRSTLKVEGTFTTYAIASLRMAQTARLDLGFGNQLVIADDGFDLQQIRSMLIAGRNGGTWDGATGITSSAAGSGSNRTIGYRVRDGVLEIDFAAAGDTNLDGSIGVQDIIAITAGGKFETGEAAGWDEGDVNYDGVVNVLDLVGMVSTGLYGKGPYSKIPILEPLGIAVESEVITGGASAVQSVTSPSAPFDSRLLFMALAIENDAEAGTPAGKKRLG